MTETPAELGEEIQRLVSAMQDWARRALPDTMSGATGARSTGGGPVADRAAADSGAQRSHGASECLPWCPICQFANVLRGEHPEVSERLTEAANAVATAMKALADAALARAQPPTPRPSDRPRPTPRVQRIRIDDADES